MPAFYCLNVINRQYSALSVALLEKVAHTFSFSFFKEKNLVPVFMMFTI